MPLEQLIQAISAKNPTSIFLYGSRTRDDFLPESDYEVGVIFKENNYTSRSELKSIANDSNFSIYPFKYNDIIHCEPDTPFQKNMYMNDLIRSGKTIFWEKVIENLEIPEITMLDIIQDIRFCLWCGLSAVISDRNGDKKTAKDLFYKPCLFATRDFIILKQKLFPGWYKQIFEMSKTVELWEFRSLVNTAFDVREGRKEYISDDLFKNVKYLNKFIETEIMKAFQEKWNITLVTEKKA